MAVSFRRIVTGHNEHGKAVVAKDDLLEAKEIRPGADACLMWTTEGFPIDNDDDFDGKDRAVATSHDNGTVLRVIQYGPGVSGRLHRTDSLDYAIVISGEIVMPLEDGESVTLKAGDVLVQRGTIHNWVNKSDAPCVIAFVLIAAKPVTVNGESLPAAG
ncbi:cupin domain-containing protein [Hoeflea sp. IMCC20628]|uniref:cupin domain-containing protein n=1 Tax=Hoeflea sp. IMCC20628 TaxID=1620421 RepID=UPI00063AA059|nr:cupin domain-containing protein [Hoeflea sp. IMCC20628]AKH98914.1 cupin domain-containing protein [Hoeflea sp. IMCC20628]